MNILTLITGNQNISRYVLRLDNNPLDPAKPDITDDLIGLGNIIPALFDGNVKDYIDIKIFIYPQRGSLKEKPLGDVFFNIDIIIPDEYITLSGLGQFRTFRIADEITKMLDGKSEIAGIGAMNVVDFINYKIPNSIYSGLTIRVLVNSVTMNG